VAQPVGYAARVIYPGTNLAAQASVERRFQIYAGPKEYNTLARLGARMNNNLDLVMDYSGFFGFFAKILLLSMNGLHAMSLSYGMAIIVITIIIKLIFWPLTKASTKSMKRMAALQPQMKALQERYKEDPVKMNRKLMEFMKENKVSPLGGCLPMLLQIPVFFGFYRMILSATELRGAQFLWACDLSKPDTLFVIPGLNMPFNLLPLIMGATMLWQARLTPASPGMDPMQQKIMKYMPLMFLFILDNFSAGLTLYWTVQNILTIAQMKLTNAKDDTAPAAATPAKPPIKPAGPPRKKK
jgi:YidC/Oxa1 family membrane protein insertase